jgi:hypothetical protein
MCHLRSAIDRLANFFFADHERRGFEPRRLKGRTAAIINKL